METDQESISARKEASRRTTGKKQPGNAQWHPLPAEHGGTLAGLAGEVWAMAECMQPISRMDNGQKVALMKTGLAKQEKQWMFGLTRENRPSTSALTTPI